MGGPVVTADARRQLVSEILGVGRREKPSGKSITCFVSSSVPTSGVSVWRWRLARNGHRFGSRSEFQARVDPKHVRDAQGYAFADGSLESAWLRMSICRSRPGDWGRGTVPTSFVTVSTLRFVLIWTIATFTFGTADPGRVDTVPTKVPRSCAKALTHSSAAIAENNSVFILLTSFYCPGRRPGHPFDLKSLYERIISPVHTCVKGIQSRESEARGQIRPRTRWSDWLTDLTMTWSNPCWADSGCDRLAAFDCQPPRRLRRNSRRRPG